ncbi:MAG: histidine kinase [Ferruginibacter sp.]|nr:histidine kinase [Ferruginibacter sp.]
MRRLLMHTNKWLLPALLLFSGMAFSQPAAINFHKLGFAEGLHDGIIKCIAQDRFGYTWIGTVGAINRFDGKKITQFTYIPGDTSTPYSSQPRCMHADMAGRFWIGFQTGITEYNFTTNKFIRVPSFKNMIISSMESINDSILLVGTRGSYFRYNTKSGKAFNYATSQKQIHAAIKQKTVNSIFKKNNLLYLATTRGLLIHDVVKDEIKEVELPELKNLHILSVCNDREGITWICASGAVRLAKISPDLKKLTKLDNYFTSGLNVKIPAVVSLLLDKKERLWLITADDGLMQFHPSTNTFTRYLHNVHYASGPSSNSYKCIYGDKSGIIWLGCHGEGVNYFEPDQNPFSTIFPFPLELSDRLKKMGRGIAVDKTGNIWMGNHDGLSRYNPVNNQYTVWRNEEGRNNVLYNNIIRTLLCDNDNNIWIGTGSGVNRYNAATGKIEFIDKLPLSFYNSINADRSGNIWFCTNDAVALYWYSVADKTYHSISQHPQLKKYAGFTSTSYLMEDSKQRLWISFSHKGMLMLDKKTGATKLYAASDSTTIGLIGNQVIDIKEDKNGWIWATTFNGITGIDADNDRFLSFNNKNGLPGNMAGPLAIDSSNRIWIGVNGGLTMLSADRKKLSVFTENEGLPSVGFNEHAGITAPGGDIIMPTNNGYFRFNPDAYKERKEVLNFYVSGYTVFNKDFYRINVADEHPSMLLKPSQSSFTFHLDALNYSNPTQTWFAYKLEGFEKEWHYTQDPKAVYTNVPGGNYQFLYKATVNNNNWDAVVAKQISVHLRSWFYNTIWFKIMIGLLIAALLFVLYRYRTRQQKQVYQLKEKAQALEKEKAQINYETLKQQLNPHFLFNSLTSLNSLIDADPKAASEFLGSLSKTYRYILKNRDTETVSLADEIRFAENYVKLQQTRFEKGFDVHINIPEEYHHRKIVPVTLQNLIENAIKHNIIDEESPLVVNIFVEEDMLVVKNNLQKKKFVETSNRQGLANMQSLYRYLSNRSVDITETNNSFTIHIPLL